MTLLRGKVRRKGCRRMLHGEFVVILEFENIVE